MYITIITISSCIGLFFGMIFLSLLGEHFAKKREEKGETARGTGAYTSAVFALLGLLIAFTFNDAFSRYYQRIHLTVKLSNAVGTAYDNMINLVPKEEQAPLREQFRRYIDVRLSLYQKHIGDDAIDDALEKIENIHEEMMAQAETASRGDLRVSLLLVPAIVEMNDTTTEQLVLHYTHPPLLVWTVLFATSLICAFLVGYGADPEKELSRWHIIGTAVAFSLALYLTLDTEYPQTGLIHLEMLKSLFEGMAEKMASS